LEISILIEQKGKKKMTESTTTELRLALEKTARAGMMDAFGVASTERFHAVHPRMRPEAHLENARAVISIGMRYPLAMVENAGRTKAESFMSMDSYENFSMIATVQTAAFDIARRLEDHGWQAVPITIKMYRVQPYKDIEESWTQDFRNDVAAAAAGHGEIGLNGVVIHPVYGTRMMYTSVVTDAPMEADAMYAGPALCDECGKCFSACKMNAMEKDRRDIVKVGDRKFKVAQKDKWRCMWSKRFMLNAEMGPKRHGLDVTIEPPSGEISEADVLAALAEKGRRGGLQTWYTYAMRECERECVPPHLRGKNMVKEHAARLRSHTATAEVGDA
jgi:ferredoxin